MAAHRPRGGWSPLSGAHEGTDCARSPPTPPAYVWSGVAWAWAAAFRHPRRGTTGSPCQRGAGGLPARHPPTPFAQAAAAESVVAPSRQPPTLHCVWCLGCAPCAALRTAAPWTASAPAGPAMQPLAQRVGPAPPPPTHARQDGGGGGFYSANTLHHDCPSCCGPLAATASRAAPQRDPAGLQWRGSRPCWGCRRRPCAGG